MMYPIPESDEQLRNRLIQHYMSHVRVYPIPEAIQAMKSELYRRGYEPTDFVKLALEALIRLQNQAN